MTYFRVIESVGAGYIHWNSIYSTWQAAWDYAKQCAPGAVRNGRVAVEECWRGERVRLINQNGDEQ